MEDDVKIYTPKSSLSGSAASPEGSAEKRGSEEK